MDAFELQYGGINMLNYFHHFEKACRLCGVLRRYHVDDTTLVSTVNCMETEITGMNAVQQSNYICFFSFCFTCVLAVFI